MTITVKINIDTPTGKRLEKELRQYPEEVQFIEPTIVSETISEGYVSIKDGFNQVKEHVKSISASESAKLAFNRLGEKYNCTFDNKYTK